jgi:hypothetical protein
MQQQALEEFSTKQVKANKLAKLLASMVGIQDIVSSALLKWFQF